MGQVAARRLVYARSEGVCEVCGLRRAATFHHRRNRSQGGLWTPQNGLHCCGDGTTGCHGCLTNTNGQRREYERMGWIVPSWRDPADVAVFHGTAGWVLLGADGALTPCAAPIL